MSYLYELKTPGKLLLSLYKNNANSSVKRSVLEIGRDFYSCNNSIYDAIDWLSDKGIISVKKLKRDLKIDFTDKGKEALLFIWGLEAIQ